MRLYLDTNVLIRAMERTDEGAADAARLIDLAARAEVSLVTSELTLAELLARPLARNDQLLVEAYLDLLTRQGLVTLHPVSREVLIAAARLLGHSRAGLADCVHVATAGLEACDLIVSYDRRLAGLSKAPVLGPSDARFATLDGEAA